MGKHLILDLSCDDKRMNDTKHIYKFLNGIVRLLKMNKLTEPIVKRGKPYLPGVSGFIMIETSHCSIHSFTQNNRLNMDIYSCNDFNEKDVKQYISKYFNNLTLLNNHLLVRNDGG